MLKRDLRLALTASIFFVAIFAGCTQALYLNVCDCKACGCQFYSVQEAVDIANTGDIVRVRGGSYHENVLVNKSIIVQGAFFKGTWPILDVGGNGSGIVVSAEGVTVERMNITNAGDSWGDAAIKVLSDNSTIMDNRVFDNGWAGIYLQSADNCTIIGNSVSDNHYGIYLEGSLGNYLCLNELSNNTVSDSFDDGNNYWDDKELDPVT